MKERRKKKVFRGGLKDDSEKLLEEFTQLAEANSKKRPEEIAHEVLRRRSTSAEREVIEGSIIRGDHEDS